MDFLQRHKRKLIVAVVVLCLAAIVWTVNTTRKPAVLADAFGYIVTPLEKGVHAVTGWVGGVFSHFSDTSQLLSENENYKAEVDMLQQEVDRLQLADQENQRLSALLKIDQKYPALPKTGAEIIGKDVGNWYSVFTIDKGSRDGIVRNMAVLGDGGLVGTISEVYLSYSTVTSIIDDGNSVAAKCVRTDDIGYVKGDSKLMSGGMCRMDNISVDAQIIVGDEIITSQLSTIYPPGITIGVVQQIQTDASGLTKTAVIEPAADFKNMETVLVVLVDYAGRNSPADSDALFASPSPTTKPAQ